MAGTQNDKSQTATAMTAGQAQAQTATLRYVDRLDVAETFADSVSGLTYDGQVLRLEFAVTRMDDVKQGAPRTGRRYPACRVVLPTLAAVELINRMAQVAAALTQAGVVKQNPATPAAPAKGQ